MNDLQHAETLNGLWIAIIDREDEALKLCQQYQSISWNGWETATSCTR